MRNDIKILFAGGGTLGPVTPLLSVAEALNAECRSFWIGTRNGPERRLVEEAGIKFSWLLVPKWRRYFDIRNFFAPALIWISVVWAFCILLLRRPNVIVTAGGFVGVPLVWAGKFLGIPALLHSQDVHFSLANRLVAPYARKITYALKDNIQTRWKGKSLWTGNPVRGFVLRGDRARGLKLCGFNDLHSTIMVIGGGTGATRLNDIIWEALPELAKKYQIIHITGRGKNEALIENNDELRRRYRVFEFVAGDMGDLLAAADLIITRAGMGVLTEVATLQKPMIIVPIPKSQQEENANYFKKHKAALVLSQDDLNGEKLTIKIQQLFQELGTLQELGERAHELVRMNAAEVVAQEVLRLAKE